MPKDKTVEHIDKAKARKSVSDFGWKMIKRGHEWQSNCGKFMVYSAGTFYKRRKITVGTTIRPAPEESS